MGSCISYNYYIPFFFSLEEGTRGGLWGGFFLLLDSTAGQSMAREEETTLVSSWKFLRFIKVHVLGCVFVIFVFFFFFRSRPRCCLSCIYFLMVSPTRN